jgi:hypothetical protein
MPGIIERNSLNNMKEAYEYNYSVVLDSSGSEGSQGSVALNIINPTEIMEENAKLRFLTYYLNAENQKLRRRIDEIEGDLQKIKDVIEYDFSVDTELSKYLPEHHKGFDHFAKTNMQELIFPEQVIDDYLKE